ncbi:MAG: hypothetical protein VSS75_011225 [Candidatus Parabeggiatoa sp.]|nr:hypothetical protein [Candidatus Parabeggiatoa sp.]
MSLIFYLAMQIDIIPETLHHPKAEGGNLVFNVRAWLEEISPNVDKHGTDPKIFLRWLV